MRNRRRSPARRNTSRRPRRDWKGLFTKAVCRVRDEIVYGIRLSIRYFARSLPYAIGAVIAMLVPVAIAFGYRYVVSAPDFGVTDVLIEGNARVSAERLLTVAGVDQAPNLLALDLQELERRLVRDPWIRSAKVERRLPDKLIMTVAEHEPKALIALGALYLVNERGVVFKRVEAGEHFEFPVLTGLSRQDVGPDAPPERADLSARLIRGALKLLEVWRHSEVGKVAGISEIHLDPLFGYSLMLGHGPPEAKGALVRLGVGQARKKLDRLNTVLADAMRKAQRLGEVRLNDERDPTRVVVRFRPLAQVQDSEGDQGDLDVEGGRLDDPERL
ncbi:MAG: cell division protein FtsQ [Myxococcota bacterium]|jgi:cell division protein FtsQ